MTKNFRSVKATLIMSIFLFSLFAAVVPSTSAAGSLFGLSQYVQIEWTNPSDMAITPSQDTRSYNFDLTYRVTKGPFGGLIYSLLVGKAVDIKLDLVKIPEGCTITLPVNTVTVNLPSNPDTPVIVSISTQISVSDTVPAFVDQEIGIKASIPQVGPIPKYDQTYTLRFKASYLGKLKVNTEKQSILIGPMDSATSIPIQVTNEGNAQTLAKFNVYDIPEDWSVLVTDHIILDPKETDTIYLTVTPPKGFGYHDDQYTFKIEYTPCWSNDPSKTGAIEQITVAVQSRGLSVIGIEVILPIIILIIVILFIAYIFIKRMLRK